MAAWLVNSQNVTHKYLQTATSAKRVPQRRNTYLYFPFLDCPQFSILDHHTTVQLCTKEHEDESYVEITSDANLTWPNDELVCCCPPGSDPELALGTTPETPKEE